jgi:hypothetical protein
MSVEQGSSPTYATGNGPASAARGEAGYADADSGFGWVVFAGTMLVLVGILNVVYGIAAIDNSKFFVNGVNYVVSDLNTWGWVVLITGAVQILAGLGVWARNTFATWLGIGFACLNGLGVLMMLPAYPLLSIALFAVDVLIVYGLAVHGGHRHEA